MKYIFDFDDVIFQTTKHRLDHMFPLLEKSGVSRDKMDEYYKEMRLAGFSLKNAISDLIKDGDLDKEKLHDEIMSTGKNYINTELIEAIKKLGKDNCFLITHGGDEFQKEKINRAGVASMFLEIIILIGSKKKAVEDICERFKDETVIFVDDKPQYFEDLDFKKYPNLKTILYTGQNIEPQLHAFELERGILPL